MIRKKRWFPSVYMFIITAFFSTIVIGFTKFTRQRVEANQRLAFEKAVLSVLPNVSVDNVNIHSQFGTLINEPTENTAGAYVYREDAGNPVYILPLSGQGFWAPIKGVIGIKADRQTITGIAFYEQNETPGLGAEITEEPFKKQFSGKIIEKNGKPLTVKRPGDQLGQSEVHAITGATQTSVRLEKIINTDVENWKKQLNKQS